MRMLTVKRFAAAFIIPLLLLLTALLASCSGEAVEDGKIYAELSGSGKEIKISAKISPSVYSAHNGHTIYLFVLEPGASAESINSLRPADRKEKPSDAVSFTLPLNDGGASRLCSGFVLAYFNSAANLYEPAVSNIAYISEPSKLSENDESYPEYLNIKGLASSLDSDAASLGISHTIIDIPIEDYILPDGSADALSSDFGGATVFFDRDAVTALDRRVIGFTESRVNVYLRFVLNKSAAELPSSLSKLAFPGTVEGAEHYALNFSDPSSAAVLTSFFDFITERYTRKDGEFGFAGSYIIGYDANTPSKHGSVGGASYETHLRCYAAALRTVNTLLTSHYKNGRVYAALDNCWLVAGGNGAADVTGLKFLTDLAALTASGGDFGWRVALNTGVSSPRIWTDNLEGDSYISPFNLSNLTTALSASALLYKDAPRALTVSGFAVSSIKDDSASMNNQAVSYAYAYYKIVENGRAEAFIYSAHTDTDEKLSGLRTADKNGKPAEKRALYDIFKTIDTDADINATVSLILSDSGWNTLYTVYSDEVRLKKLSTGAAETTSADAYDTSPLFSFGEGGTQGFRVCGGDSFLYLTRQEQQTALTAELLKLCPAEAPFIVKEGIDKDDLNGKYLLVPISISTVGEGASQSCTVTLSLTQDGTKNHSVYEASAIVPAGESTTVVFNVGSFCDKLGKGDVTLRLSFSSSDGSGYTVKISEILTGKDRRNTPLLVILIIIGVLAVGGGITALIFWFRKNYTIDISNGKSDKKDGSAKHAKPKKPDAPSEIKK